MLRLTLLLTCVFLFNISIVANVDAYVNDFRAIPSFSLNKLKTVAGQKKSDANQTFLTRAGRPSSDHVGAAQYAASISSGKSKTKVDNKMGAAIMSLGVVVILATDIDADSGTLEMGRMLSVVMNIMDSAFPMTAQDAITLVLGEQAGVLVTAVSNCGIKMAVKVVSLLSKMDFLVLDKSEPTSQIPTERRMIPEQEKSSLLSAGMSLEPTATPLSEECNEKHSLGVTSPRQASDLTTICLYDYDSQSWDPVEIFRDVTTWLSYSVLQNDFTEIFNVNNYVYMDEMLQSGFFGVLATLAAHIYADLLYGYFQVGDESQIKRVQERSAISGVLHYSKASLVAFSYFAVYQFVKVPARTLITTLVSGGIDQCVGSEDINICMDSFVESGSHLLDASPLMQMETLLISFGYLADELPELVDNTQLLSTVLTSLWFRIIS